MDPWVVSEYDGYNFVAFTEHEWVSIENFTVKCKLCFVIQNTFITGHELKFSGSPKCPAKRFNKLLK